jgi:hypothetical protein
MLAPDVSVDCPVSEKFVCDSPLELRHDGNRYVIVGPDDMWPVDPVPRPRWYDIPCTDGDPPLRTDSDGRAVEPRANRFGSQDLAGRAVIQSLGQVCGDRLTISVSSRCALFSNPALRCAFCSIGFNGRRERSPGCDGDIHPMIALALQDPAHPVRHVLIGGGTRDLDDRGYGPVIALAQSISRAFPALPLSAMTVPPSDDGQFEHLRDAGVEELAINIEVWSTAAAAEHTPGKHRLFGRAGYLQALSRALEVFGARRVRSLVVAGLEPMTDTLSAVEALARLGVIPVISPFRPLRQTSLQDRSPPSLEFLLELHEAALAICHRHDTCLGPLCEGCQGNTLTVHGLSDIGPASTGEDTVPSRDRGESASQADHG